MRLILRIIASLTPGPLQAPRAKIRLVESEQRGRERQDRRPWAKAIRSVMVGPAHSDKAVRQLVGLLSEAVPKLRRPPAVTEAGGALRVVAPPAWVASPPLVGSAA